MTLIRKIMPMAVATLFVSAAIACGSTAEGRVDSAPLPASDSVPEWEKGMSRCHPETRACATGP